MTGNSLNQIGVGMFCQHPVVKYHLNHVLHGIYTIGLCKKALGQDFIRCQNGFMIRSGGQENKRNTFSSKGWALINDFFHFRPCHAGKVNIR